MFPIIALGAAIVGAAAAVISSNSDKPERSRSNGEARANPRSIASPQSYLVTPVASVGAARATESVSVADAIDKFIV